MRDKIHEHFTKWLVFLACFIISSYIMTTYEQWYATNLFTEGLIGNSILCVMGFFVVMGFREFFAFTKNLQIQANQEKQIISQEVISW